jgi:hypothetical protein
MYRKFAVIGLSILLFAFVSVGCSKVGDGVKKHLQGDIQTGLWSEDGKTFTNEWANFSLTLPIGYHALSPDEMREVFNVGENIIINDGLYNKSEVNLAMMLAAYDFMILADTVMGLPNMVLMYENLGTQPKANRPDEAAYFEILVAGLESLETLAYARAGISTKKLAGDDWYVGTMSVAGGLLYQDYYLKKVDKTIVSLLVSYTDDTRAAADALVASIKKISN